MTRLGRPTGPKPGFTRAEVVAAALALGVADFTLAGVGARLGVATETIPEDRIAVFEPLNLVTPEGTTAMVQTGSDNYHYEVKADLKKFSWVLANPVAVPDTPPVRGKQGLFEVTLQPAP